MNNFKIGERFIYSKNNDLDKSGIVVKDLGNGKYLADFNFQKNELINESSMFKNFDRKVEFNEI